ncbi:hypothetical protein MAHJHV34_49570 [Mycobacterium avium subsp. hominissuis]
MLRLAAVKNCSMRLKLLRIHAMVSSGDTAFVSSSELAPVINQLPTDNRASQSQ